MPPYRVIPTAAFNVDLEAIGPEGYDWTATREGIQWYLSHNPLAVGYGTQDTQVRIYLQDRPMGLSGVKVFYLIEGATVTLIRARSFDIQNDG